MSNNSSGHFSMESSFEEYREHLYTWVRTHVGSELQRSCDPEDVLQEVWLRVSQRPPEGPIEYPRAWLLKVTSNVLHEFLRGHMREVQHVARNGDTAIGEAPARVTSVTRKVVRAEAWHVLHAEIDRLDDMDRELFLMYQLEGYSLAEVATRLGIKPAAATKRWQRLRARLARLGSPLQLLA